MDGVGGGSRGSEPLTGRVCPAPKAVEAGGMGTGTMRASAGPEAKAVAEGRAAANGVEAGARMGVEGATVCLIGSRK